MPFKLIIDDSVGTLEREQSTVDKVTGTNAEQRFGAGVHARNGWLPKQSAPEAKNPHIGIARIFLNCYAVIRRSKQVAKLNLRPTAHADAPPTSASISPSPDYSRTKLREAKFVLK